MVATIDSSVVVLDFLDTSCNETLDLSDSGTRVGMPLLTVAVTHGALYPPLLNRVSRAS